TVHIVDLMAQRLLRKVRLGGRRPLDIAADCGHSLVLVDRPFGLVVIDGRRGPCAGPVLAAPRCHGTLEPRRVASGPMVLWCRPGTSFALVAAVDGTVFFEVDGATDLDLGPDGLLVVARAPGQALRRFRRDGDGWVELEPVGAPGYDGGAVAIGPNRRIAFTTPTGVGTTSGPAACRVTYGTVTTYRLDSGAYRTRWGRLFLDACLPPGTSVGVEFLTSDEDDVRDPLPRTPPERGARRVRHEDRTPPLPSETLLTTVDKPIALFRRPTGREQVWAPAAADPETGAALQTYEAPVTAPPGRYLWVQLELTGTARVSPRVRAIRVERPGHPLLRTLPRGWSRNEADADFLHRFLSPAEGLLHELDRHAAERGVLVDPGAVPADVLPWLGSFAGLVLDQRWSDRARRALVAEAYPLFRRRGTKEALARVLALYLGIRPGIVEQWRLRGLGGAVLGTSPRGLPAPAIRGAARATGTLGRFSVGGASPGQDSYAASAHRFAVLVPGRLTDEQRTVVRTILDGHRPAHTVYDLCELGPGMRVGRQLRVALTSYVGPGAATSPAVVGQVTVGGDAVVGQPGVGSRLGSTSVAGQVRVG
ncbi:MAG: phage tail protein, partial [Pseudonocardiaceae bacterium]